MRFYVYCIEHSSFCNSYWHEEFGQFKILMRTNITKTSMELFQSPTKLSTCINTHVPFSFTDLTNRCKALHVIYNRSDVESFFLALEQLHGSFSNIGARQDFQRPEFFMPELLLNELWYRDPFQIHNICRESKIENMNIKHMYVNPINQP